MELINEAELLMLQSRNWREDPPYVKTGKESRYFITRQTTNLFRAKYEPIEEEGNIWILGDFGAVAHAVQAINLYEENENERKLKKADNQAEMLEKRMVIAIRQTEQESCIELMFDEILQRERKNRANLWISKAEYKNRKIMVGDTVTLKPVYEQILKTWRLVEEVDE